MSHFYISKLRVQALDFDASQFHLKLRNGICLQFPLKQGRFASIAQLTQEQQKEWHLVDDGFGVVWPAIKRRVGLANQPVIHVLDLVWDKLVEWALDKESACGGELEKLAEVEQDIAILWRLEADIYNGGYMQFLCNWGDACCRKAIAVLEKIEAKNAHQLVFSMRAMLERFENNSAINSFEDVLKGLTFQEKELMESLEDAYCQDSDRIVKKAVTYFGDYFCTQFLSHNESI